MAEGNNLATQPDAAEVEDSSDADFEPDRLDMADGPDDRYHSGTGELINDESYDRYLDNNSDNYWNG